MIDTTLVPFGYAFLVIAAIAAGLALAAIVDAVRSHDADSDTSAGASERRAHSELQHAA